MNGSPDNEPARLQRFRKLRGRLAESAPTDDDTKRRLAGLLSPLLLAASILGLLIPFKSYLGWRSYSIADTVILAGIGLFLAAYFINRRGHFRTAVFLAVFSSALATFLVFLLPETNYENAELLYYLIIPILLLDFFLNLREYILSSSIILIGVLTLQPLDSHVTDVFVFLSSLTIILGCASFFRRRLERERRSALREADRKYRTLVEEIPVITYIDRMDTLGTTIYISPQIQTVLGIRPEEWLASQLDVWIGHMHPDDRQATMKKYLDAQKNGLPLDMEYRMIHPDGREVWVRDRAAVEKDNNGKPIFFHGVMSDITVRKLSEIALEKSEERYRTIFEMSGVGIWEEDYSELIDAIDELKTAGITDFRAYFEEHPEFVQKACRLIKIRNVNMALVHMLGAKNKDEILGPLDCYFTEEALGPFKDELLALAEGRPHYENETVTLTKQGQSINEWVSINFPRTREGFKRVLVVTVNITERKQAEKIRELLLEVGEAVHTSRDLKVLLEAIHRSLGKLMDVGNFHVALRESPDTDVFSFPFHANPHETFPDVKDLTGSLTAYVARTAEAMLVDSAMREQFVREKKIQSTGDPPMIWMGAPLKSQDGVIGVVVLQSYNDPHLYTENHIRILQLFSDHIALAVQRKRAEEALRASEERFRNIFEFSGIPIWVEDFSGMMEEIVRLRGQGVSDIRGYALEHPEFILQAAGKIKVVDVNNAVLELFETNDKAELLGPLGNLYSEESLANFREEILALAEGKTYYQGEATSFTLTGKRRDEWVITSILDKEHLDRVLVTVLNFSERKQRERELEALATVSAALRHAAKKADMLPVILDQILLLLNGEGAGIAMSDPITGDGIMEATRGAWSNITNTIIPAGTGVYSRVIATGQPFVTDDLQNEELVYNREIIVKGMKSMAVLPLNTSNEKKIGAIYIGRENPFTTFEILTLTNIADMAANAIQRVSAHELALHRAEQLSIVNEIGRTLAETLDLEQIYDQLHRAVFHLLPDTNSLFISTYDSEQQLINCVFGVENDQRINPADLPTLPLRPPGEGTQSEIIHTGRPLIVGNLPEKLQNAPTRVIVGTADPITQSALYVPMIAHNNVIGILQVQSYTPNRYTDTDAELLSVVANTAAGAIENARLFEEVHQRIDQLQALHDIDAAISSSHDLRVTLDILLSNTITLLGVDAADVLQLNPHTYNLAYAAGQGFKTPFHEIERLPFEQGFAGRVASERNIVTVTVFSAQEVNPGIDSFLKQENFKTYVGIPLTAKGMIIGILEIYHRSHIPLNAHWMDFLKTLASQAALAIDNTELFIRLQESNTQLMMAYDATIEGWSHALDLRDKETEGHTQRVTELTVRLARAMSIPEQELLHIRRGALLHDIGKMGVPDNILLKPDKLTDEEWEIMRRHPQYAYDLLSPIRYLWQSLDIPYSHHEHWDGKGYPRGLKGEQIPLAARVFAVVDVWDALRSDRPYRSAWPEEKVMDYIKSLAGTQFDPRVVDAFVKMMRK